jgi:phage gpG-like protein
MPLTISVDTKKLAADIEGVVQITSQDVLYALNRQKARILDRTARGVDINGQAFEPYSTKGPYYYYPAKAGRTAGSRKSSAGRFAKKVGGQRTTVGVKFPSYADFKRSLGRSGVDLTGPRAPHMLQAIVVKTTGNDSGVIGIYGPEADRAEGHNVGAGHLPRREFFGFSDRDHDEMVADVDRLIAARLGKIL